MSKGKMSIAEFLAANRMEFTQAEETTVTVENMIELFRGSATQREAVVDFIRALGDTGELTMPRFAGLSLIQKAVIEYTELAHTIIRERGTDIHAMGINISSYFHGGAGSAPQTTEFHAVTGDATPPLLVRTLKESSRGNPKSPHYAREASGAGACVRSLNAAINEAGDEGEENAPPEAIPFGDLAGVTDSAPMTDEL